MTDSPADATPTPYRVWALHYGQRRASRGQHFLGRDERSGDPHDIAYYAWLLSTDERTVLVDCGMAADAEPPLDGWRFREPVPALLAANNIRPDDVDDVVLTHLHYDHAGGIASFPRARVVIQRTELDFWRGQPGSWLVPARQLTALEALGDRLHVPDGDALLSPGLSVHLIGGHTAGLQVVRVQTETGPVVIASDACHFQENLETNRPGLINHRLADVHSGFERLRALAAGGIVLPGHDPLVAQMYADEPAPAAKILRIV